LKASCTGSWHGLDLTLPATSSRSPIKKIVSPTSGSKVQQTSSVTERSDEFSEAVVQRLAMPADMSADRVSADQWIELALTTRCGSTDLRTRCPQADINRSQMPALSAPGSMGQFHSWTFCWATSKHRPNLLKLHN